MNLEWITVVISIIALVIVLFGLDASYKNGASDGYGYSREPGNPGYRRAGLYLFHHMSYRWRGIPDPSDPGEAVIYGQLDIWPKPDAKRYIELTPAEIQSGLDRVRYAEMLIKQLPADHDGRNTWLMNYGSKE
jgi:hypothetical protein